MTGHRVLKGKGGGGGGDLPQSVPAKGAAALPDPPSPGGVIPTDDNANQVLTFPEANQGTIKKLQDVVVLLQTIDGLNSKLQGQYAVGSAAWHTCESIDDRLHDIYVLLGE